MSNRLPPRLKQALARAEQMPVALGRRHLLKAAAAMAIAGLLPAPARAASRLRLMDDPFSLGVASGFPQADSVVLWTRLAPDPLNGGGMPAQRVAVRWELAEDEAFSRGLRSGTSQAAPELAHSVHVEATGLAPGREYFFRFMAGEAVSPIGRTRTLPAADSAPSSLRIALGSCQHFEQGWFDVYRHMRADAPDLVLFVGDYIYENSWGDDLVRQHVGAEPRTLDEYRNRYAQYRRDPNLAAMHASVPWIVTLDDHEVDNDWAADDSEHLDPQFALRKAAALQAYFEHMPLPWSALRAGSRLHLHRHVDIGTLARICVLDDRQYREPIPCPRPGMAGSQEVRFADCPELDAPRSMLGSEQERWLDQTLARSPAHWNLIAQQTLLAPLVKPLQDGPGVWTDGWDGYPAARRKLLDSLSRRSVANPVVLGGDYHCTWAADLHHEDRLIASELCGPSICSQGWPQDGVDAARAINPHVHYGNSNDRGYLLLQFDREGCMAQLRAAESVKSARTEVSTLQRFRIEAGKPGVSLV